LRKISYLIWSLSLLYFIVYAMSHALRGAVNQNASLAILHGGLGIIFLGGIFGFILLRLWRVFH
jgi:bacteriorhodopsin